jgi:hypothetical protein
MLLSFTSNAIFIGILVLRWLLSGSGGSSACWSVCPTVELFALKANKNCKMGAEAHATPRNRQSQPRSALCTPQTPRDTVRDMAARRVRAVSARNRRPRAAHAERGLLTRAAYKESRAIWGKRAPSRCRIFD